MRNSPPSPWTVRLAAAVGCVALACTGHACAADPDAFPEDARIILLHHSTGECIWNGGVPQWFQAYNARNGTRYVIAERNFPKESPYGWENYPYDYWNIWVRHGGPKPFQEEPTLEILAAQYNVIVLKHCFPVSNIEHDTGSPDVESNEKRAENYRLQYAALKKKMRQFRHVRFLVWTGAAQVENDTDEAQARRARAFFDWVKAKWDEKGDNIYVWDFHELETEGGLYAKTAHTSGDAHPNEAFSSRVAPMLCQRIVDVIQGRGDATSLLGRPGTPAAASPAPAPVTQSAASDHTPPPAPPAAPEPQPAAAPLPPGPGRWVLDDAEDAQAQARNWPEAGRYVKDGDENVIRINFAAGEEEDWGEYGRQRVVLTRPPTANYDLKPYRYLALRLKADRDMEVVLSLLTLPDPGAGRHHQSHFGFSAYLRPTPGRWKWVALDLAKLELAAEGEQAYREAGEPARPMQLTALKFTTNARNEAATLLVDDITFFRDLPDELAPCLQAP